MSEPLLLHVFFSSICMSKNKVSNFVNRFMPRFALSMLCVFWTVLLIINL